MVSCQTNEIEMVNPGFFDQNLHFYPKVINAQIHPLISFFLNLSKDRMIKRYCHLRPKVNKEKLIELMNYQPEYLPWAGSDLFYTSMKTGIRRMVVVETNSCPSGQKSMPLIDENEEEGGYKELIEQTFLKILKKKEKIKGKFAVIYDKNYMEASGYAQALANATKEKVFLVTYFDNSSCEHLRFSKGVLEIYHNKKWIPIRAALRYVTQKPWKRIPIKTKTFIFNPILGCLAGGRNKMLAAKAYDLLNHELTGTGISINVPETIQNVSKTEIPLWIKRFNGLAVIKIPYSNAGQGVFTITNKTELDEFMKEDHAYDQFIVQSLIGNSTWSSKGANGKFYHIGTIPNKTGEIFVADIRMMLISTQDGIKPTAIYARRSKKPLTTKVPDCQCSWDMLGTNLSIKLADNKWDSDTSRLLIMDRKDFNTLGIGMDDLIEGYIQTLLSIIAIDKLAKKLIDSKGEFKMELFKSLSNDEIFTDEIKLK